MKHSLTYNLSILYYQENAKWVAQCLEWDIIGHGNSLDSALESFENMFVGQIVLDIDHGRNPLETTSKAPKECWDMFRLAKRLSDRKPFYLPDDIVPSYAISATAEDQRIAA